MSQIHLRKEINAAVAVCFSVLRMRLPSQYRSRCAADPATQPLTDSSTAMIGMLFSRQSLSSAQVWFDRLSDMGITAPLR